MLSSNDLTAILAGRQEDGRLSIRHEISTRVDNTGVQVCFGMFSKSFVTWSYNLAATNHLILMLRG